MGWVALLTIVAWLTVLAVARGVLHARAGGGPALRLADRRGSPQWWTRLLGTLGFGLLIAGAVADILGAAAPIAILDQPGIQLGGLVVVLAGAALSIRAQAAMGDAWRGDVDPDATTPLVTDGPFRWVRNPIFTGTAMTAMGIALLVPNPITIAGAAITMVTHEVQVRLVEEPYLRRVHGDAWRAYAARTGRFLPGIGRDRPA